MLNLLIICYVSRDKDDAVKAYSYIDPTRQMELLTKHLYKPVHGKLYYCKICNKGYIAWSSCNVLSLYWPGFPTNNYQLFANMKNIDRRTPLSSLEKDLLELAFF